jgi:telomerase reverse transcriptase
MVRDECPVSAIPGVVSVYPNHHVTALKSSPWPQVLALMGKLGTMVMIDLILDCGVFIPVECGHGNYYQLSGMLSFWNDLRLPKLTEIRYTIG